MKKNNQLKLLILSIVISLAAGGISYFLTGSGYESYQKSPKPPLFPPAILFPIVWTVLYILMGIAFYLYIRSAVTSHKLFLSSGAGRDVIITSDIKNGILFFCAGWLLNIVWSPVYFRLDAPFAALIILAILWFCVLQTFLAFRKENRLAGWLFIPYLLWCTFALYLNFAAIIFY